MQLLRRVALCCVLVLLSGITAGCDRPQRKTPVPPSSIMKAELTAPPEITAGVTEWRIKFTATAVPESDRHAAHLRFCITCAGEPAGTMEFSDPKSPVPAALETEFCTARITPRILEPKITSRRDEECSVDGYYDLAIHAPTGDRIGMFHINEVGVLELDSDSINPHFDVELLSASVRTMYVVYRLSTTGVRSQPLFGLEYRHDECKSVRDLAAADGWKYRFQYADGMLRALPPATLAGWPEYLRAKAAEERGELAQQHSEQIEQLKKEDCRGGG